MYEHVKKQNPSCIEIEVITVIILCTVQAIYMYLVCKVEESDSGGLGFESCNGHLKKNLLLDKALKKMVHL